MSAEERIQINARGTRSAPNRAPGARHGRAKLRSIMR
jgi:hypothetical protein